MIRGFGACDAGLRERALSAPKYCHEVFSSIHIVHMEISFISFKRIIGRYSHVNMDKKKIYIYIYIYTHIYAGGRRDK